MKNNDDHLMLTLLSGSGNDNTFRKLGERKDSSSVIVSPSSQFNCDSREEEEKDIRENGKTP
jgi:hypothetical protein